MKKLILFVVVLMAFSGVVFADFSDVNESTDYNDAILWMADNGVINGYGDGSFGPDECVKRAEFLKMLYETLEVNEDEANGLLFTDTYADQWYVPYVLTARVRGTVQGYSDGTFRPGQCVNRVEAIKMAVLEFHDGVVPPNEGGFFNLTDVDLSAWYFETLEYAYLANVLGREHIYIIPDTDAGYFYPAEPMSRKEVAEMLYRMKVLKDRGYETYVDWDDSYNLTPFDIGEDRDELETVELDVEGGGEEDSVGGSNNDGNGEDDSADELSGYFEWYMNRMHYYVPAGWKVLDEVQSLNDWYEHVSSDYSDGGMDENGVYDVMFGVRVSVRMNERTDINSLDGLLDYLNDQAVTGPDPVSREVFEVEEGVGVVADGVHEVYYSVDNMSKLNYLYFIEGGRLYELKFNYVKSDMGNSGIFETIKESVFFGEPGSEDEEEGADDTADTDDADDQGSGDEI